jgi:hypothetical protein
MTKPLMTLALALAFALPLVAADKPTTARRQHLELRTYLLNEGGDSSVLEAYLKDAFIPACKRLGIGPIGVFKEKEASDAPKLYVLITYNQMSQWATLDSKLNADKVYKKDAAAYLNAPKDSPAYARIQSSLMRAFAGMPQLAVPNRKPRFFELRIYESHSEQKHKLKVEMFNRGEIDVFRNVGMSPVFFGQNLVGDNIPALTYMNVYYSQEGMDKQWAGFRTDPGWDKLKKMERYKGTVSKIHKVMLEPTLYSGI